MIFYVFTLVFWNNSFIINLSKIYSQCKLVRRIGYNFSKRYQMPGMTVKLLTGTWSIKKIKGTCTSIQDATVNNLTLHAGLHVPSCTKSKLQTVAGQLGLKSSRPQCQVGFWSMLPGFTRLSVVSIVIYDSGGTIKKTEHMRSSSFGLWKNKVCSLINIFYLTNIAILARSWWI